MEGYENTYLEEDNVPQQHQPLQSQHQQPHQQQQIQHHQLIQQHQIPQRSVQIPHHQTVVDEEELFAAQQAAAEASALAHQQQQQAAQQGQPSAGAFNNVGQGLSGNYRDIMMQYWQETINSIEHDEHDFKNHQLPLARIKKVMKTDEDVRMISAEAPILFAKGCDIFITELTMRAWIHAEENKRRTLQKSDIAAALTKSDMFDFLIDVVPREEEKPKKNARASWFVSQNKNEDEKEESYLQMLQEDRKQTFSGDSQNVPQGIPLQQLPSQQTQQILPEGEGYSAEFQAPY